MVDDRKMAYPTVPESAWWLLRRRFSTSIPKEVTPSYLAGVLNISPGSSANVLPGLRAIGLVDDKGKPTNLASRWRTDTEYAQVCEEIKVSVYPDDLLDTFLEPMEDSLPLRNWFLNKLHVGENAARKMASFYQLLLEADPSRGIASTAPGKTAKRTGATSANATKTQGRTRPSHNVAGISPGPHTVAAQTEPLSDTSHVVRQSTRGGLSLHIDLQIHISPEASPEQIDKIFESMAKHLPLDK